MPWRRPAPRSESSRHTHAARHVPPPHVPARPHVSAGTCPLRSPARPFSPSPPGQHVPSGMSLALDTHPPALPFPRVHPGTSPPDHNFRLPPPAITCPSEPRLCRVCAASTRGAGPDSESRCRAALEMLPPGNEAETGTCNRRRQALGFADRRRRERSWRLSDSVSARRRMHCHVPRTATFTSLARPPSRPSHGHRHVPRAAAVTSLARPPSRPSRGRSHVPRRLTAGNHDSEDAVGRVGSRLTDIQVAMPSDSDSGAACHRPVRDPSAAGPGSASIRRPSRWALGGVLREL
jgi:hypothetical protein